MAQKALTKNAMINVAYWTGVAKGKDGEPVVDAMLADANAGTKAEIKLWFNLGLFWHPAEDALAKIGQMLTSDAMLKAVGDVFGAAAVVWITSALGVKKP